MTSRGDREIAEALDEAVADLAHAFRVPLAVILGYAQLLQIRDDEATRREAPVQIQQAAEEIGRKLAERLDRVGDGADLS